MAVTPTRFPDHSSGGEDPEATEVLPVTSYACQWKPPRKRKESNLKISEARFEKHVYGKLKKRGLSSLEEFDPRPPEYRGTANSELSTFLGKVRGRGLGVSLLFDSSTRVWTKESPSMPAESPDLPCRQQLEQTVREFKSSLHVSEQRAREIEQATREQRHSPEWYSVRRYRLTASLFGQIYHRKPDTRPDALVLRLIKPRQFMTPAIEWGIKNEALAIEAYTQHQQCNGHNGLTVCKVGFHVSSSHPFLGASPDGGVYDPSCDQPYGFVEVKCPYSHRNHTPAEACADNKFFCTLESGQVKLRQNSNYFCQVQGQMAIGERLWCDFVVHTPKGISIERITFDQKYWDNVVIKLTEFYDNCFAPEIVSPLHSLGLPMRDLRKD